MTFQVPAYAVDGNSEPGNFLRLMLQSATIGSQGVVGPLDCQVTQTGVASAGIIITPGACVVLGQETTFQGSYYGYNVGNDTTLSISSTAGSIRSDLIVVRAEDPTWAGSPWGNPASGQILFPRVISGVSGSTVVAPGGISAIALARIDIPVSTSIITNAMIHDVRQVANPQRIFDMQAVTGPGSPSAWSTGTTNVQFPTGATWSIQIPVWATSMVCMWQASELLYQNLGNGVARGWIWPVIGSSITAPTVQFPLSLVSMNSSTGPWRHTIGGGGKVAIPASMRGTTQTLQFAQKADGTNTGKMAFDEGSGVQIAYEFQQLAAAA